MSPEEAEALLRRSIVAELGEVRARELAPVLRPTAEALALIMSEPIGIDEEDPDFARRSPSGRYFSTAASLMPAARARNRASTLPPSLPVTSFFARPALWMNVATASILLRLSCGPP